MLPAELVVPSARMALMDRSEGGRALELEMLGEKRDEAVEKMKEYQRKLMLAYDKQVRPRMFVEGETVMKAVDAVMRKQAMAKWAPKWEGPFIVQEAHPNGHCILLNPETGKKTGPINFKYVKKYYA